MLWPKWALKGLCGWLGGHHVAGKKFHATNLIKSVNSSSAPRQCPCQVSPWTTLLEGRPTIYWAGRPPIEPTWPLAWLIASPSIVDPMTLVKFKLWRIFMGTHEYIISSSDVPEMIIQQNSWNSSKISIYSLYLIWNMEMLVVQTGVLWPPTTNIRLQCLLMHINGGCQNARLQYLSFTYFKLYL
jgi:hypothetical protein